MFTILPHTADVGLRVEAEEINALFEEAGRGLFSLIVSNLEEVRSQRWKEIAIEGKDMEYLFFDFLNELLFIFESEGLLLREFDVSVGPRGLQAIAGGEKIDRERHRMAHEVKAITYHGLMVKKIERGWVAEVIVDI